MKEATMKEMLQMINERLIRLENKEQFQATKRVLGYSKIEMPEPEQVKRFEIQGYCLSKKAYKSNGIPEGYTTISVIISNEVKEKLDAFHKSN